MIRLLNKNEYTEEFEMLQKETQDINVRYEFINFIFKGNIKLIFFNK